MHALALFEQWSIWSFQRRIHGLRNNDGSFVNKGNDDRLNPKKGRHEDISQSSKAGEKEENPRNFRRKKMF